VLCGGAERKFSSLKFLPDFSSNSGWMLDPIHCNGLPQEKRPRWRWLHFGSCWNCVRTQQLLLRRCCCSKQRYRCTQTQNRLLSEQFYLPKRACGKSFRTHRVRVPPTGSCSYCAARCAPKTNREASEREIRPEHLERAADDLHPAIDDFTKSVFISKDRNGSTD